MDGQLDRTKKSAQGDRRTHLIRMRKQVLIRMLILAACGIGVWLWLSQVRVGVVKREKLADCTTNAFEFQMPCKYFGPYAIILGMPASWNGDLDFSGNMVIRQNGSLVTNIAISSEKVTACNWLDKKYCMAGYILTWPGKYETNNLDDLLHHGQLYDVRVSFTELPPADSSLWLASTEMVGVFTRNPQIIGERCPRLHQRHKTATVWS